MLNNICFLFHSLKSPTATDRPRFFGGGGGVQEVLFRARAITHARTHTYEGLFALIRASYVSCKQGLVVELGKRRLYVNNEILRGVLNPKSSEFVPKIDETVAHLKFPCQGGQITYISLVYSAHITCCL